MTEATLETRQPDESSIPLGRMQRFHNAAVTPGIGVGIICGFVSAILYTFSNISLRHSVAADPLLVAAMKALPTVLCLSPFLIWLKLRGHAITTSGRLVPRFVLVSLLGQVGGNGSFQIALGNIGLAASVPITLGSLLIGSAIVGRIILGETVRRRTAIAIGILILAVIALSQSGQPDAVVGDAVISDAVDSKLLTSSATAVIDSAELSHRRWLGAGCAVFSGLCFAVFSSTMRLNMQRGMQGVTAMWISGMVGSTALFAIVAWRGGLADLSQITPELWWSMGSAGVFNFLAFIAITTAIKVLPIVAVHLLNASQVAMAATAGVVLFAEPVTSMLLTGIVLTMVGLLVLAKRRTTSAP